MSTPIRLVFIALLIIGVTGCAAYSSQPELTAQQQCERSGGIWRAASDSCQREAGGGGGGY